MAAGEKRNALHLSGPVDVGAGKYKYLTEAYTVTYSDSGTTFVLKGGTGHAITMPAYKEGFNCRFITTEAFGTNYVITLTAAVGSGVFTVAGAVVTCSAATTFNIIASAEALGDWLTFEDVDDITVVNGHFQTSGGLTNS
jgi:hypothetical protein